MKFTKRHREKNEREQTPGAERPYMMANGRKTCKFRVEEGDVGP